MIFMTLYYYPSWSKYKEAEINCAVMAAEQISNFLKDGVIVNSVNFPSIKLGRKTEYRMVIINKNEPGMIGKITDKIGYKNINIADMTQEQRLNRYKFNRFRR